MNWSQTLVGWLVMLLLQGTVLSQVVDALKGHPFVRSHPKLVAAILTLGVTLALTYFNVGAPWDQVVVAWYAAFMTAIGAHELKDAVLRYVGRGQS
jgi:hypothetical protein